MMEGTTKAALRVVDSAIFEQMQANIDEDSQVWEGIRNILQKLERQGPFAFSVVDVSIFQLMSRESHSICLKSASIRLLMLMFEAVDS